MIRAEMTDNPSSEITASLSRIAPHCAWTSGNWGGHLKLAWNDIQATNQHVARLARHLCLLDRELASPIDEVYLGRRPRPSSIRDTISSAIATPPDARHTGMTVIPTC